ncbi:hypothetical protein DdX_03464 [Ditylenchus destructor]|uniref:Uncharacterized protein n=1 Tax=Ditylenchus destructor TaxID=166010 RepID=A0AAD4RBC4_9BILA|nr:hypothetical protein DdX_03464 [Ditylenchus destructor]
MSRHRRGDKEETVMENFGSGKRFAASRGVTRRPSHQQPHFCHSNLFLKVESGAKEKIPPLRPHLPIVAVWNTAASSGLSHPNGMDRFGEYQL